MTARSAVAAAVVDAEVAELVAALEGARRGEAAGLRSAEGVALRAAGPAAALGDWVAVQAAQLAAVDLAAACRLAARVVVLAVLAGRQARVAERQELEASQTPLPPEVRLPAAEQAPARRVAAGQVRSVEQREPVQRARQVEPARFAEERGRPARLAPLPETGRRRPRG